LGSACGRVFDCASVGGSTSNGIFASGIGSPVAAEKQSGSR
jgi:hypothetical protein